MILEVPLRTWYHGSRISKTGERASFLPLAGSVVQHRFALLKTSCLALNWGGNYAVIHEPRTLTKELSA